MEGKKPLHKLSLNCLIFLLVPKYSMLLRVVGWFVLGSPNVPENGLPMAYDALNGP